MSNMSGAIKEIVKGYLNNINLSDLIFGEVINDDPIKIKITNGLELSENFLIIPEKLARDIYEVEYLGETMKLTLKDIKLKKKDRVAILKATGGQKYYILDRVM